MATKTGKKSKTTAVANDGVIRQTNPKKRKLRLTLKCLQCNKPFSIQGMSPSASPDNLPPYKRLCLTCRQNRTPGQPGFSRGKQVWTRSGI